MLVFDTLDKHVIIDSTIVWAHPCAAGAPQKTVVNNLKRLVEAEASSPRRYM